MLLKHQIYILKIAIKINKIIEAILTCNCFKTISPV